MSDNFTADPIPCIYRMFGCLLGRRGASRGKRLLELGGRRIVSKSKNARMRIMPIQLSRLGNICNFGCTISFFTYRRTRRRIPPSSSPGCYCPVVLSVSDGLAKRIVWVILWCMDRDGLLDDKWDSVDFPVLKAVVTRWNAASYPAVQTHEIAADTGLDVGEVLRSVTRLASADFIDAQNESREGQRDCIITGCSRDAQVLTGVWPSPERLIARLEDELEKEIDEAPEGSAKHQKLSALLESLKNIAEGTTSAVLTEVVLRATGMKA
ncbi:hypothetical protein [Bifidobacterium sp.]|uniref:hypothetical protein n=2 Tax=Bifidobacterium sp. TaxID=41200 RepID=UPI0039ECAD21